MPGLRTRHIFHRALVGLHPIYQELYLVPLLTVLNQQHVVAPLAFKSHSVIGDNSHFVYSSLHQSAIFGLDAIYIDKAIKHHW